MVDTLNFSIEEITLNFSGAEETLAVSITEETLHFSFAEIIQLGGGDSDVPYAKRTDFTTDFIYRAEATPGSINSNPVWRIWRIDIAVDDDVVEQWADGSANFNQIWDDRLTLSYV